MGKKAEKEKAKAYRDMAGQMAETRAEAKKVKYDKDEVLANLKAASEQIPEIAGLYEAVLRDPSALEDIETDPRFDEIMKGNLEAVQEMAEEGGFTEEDKSKRRALQRMANADDSARQKSIVQSMMQRGQAGSGTELLARLGSSQATAQRQAEASDRLAMDSASARRAAIQQASQQAQSMKGQSFGQQSQKASAKDQIAQFNAMQRQRSQDANLQQKQQQENIKAQQAAQYHQGAANAEQQRFANEMSRLGLQSNLSQAEGQARAAGVAPRTNWGAIAGTALGAGLGAFGGPAGATAGAQVGGAVGGAFKDGGMRYNNGGTAEPLPTMRGGGVQEGVVESGQTSPEDLQRIRTREGEYAQLLEEKAVQKENKDKMTALQAIVGGMGKATATPEAPSFDPMKFDSSVQNVNLMPQGIAAADGAVKMTADDMRDMLMQEVDSFAHGGVKYEDGGITPELVQASQMLRTNQPAPASPMPGGQPPMPEAPMPPQGIPMDPNMMPPQGVPMPPQGQMMNDGGMNYESGGEGTIIDSGTENYEGDELPDRINDREIVFNVEQQDRVNDQLMELKRLKSKQRTDKMLSEGSAEVNAEQQEALMAFARGEIDIDDLPNDRIVKEPTIGEPTGRMADFIGMLSKKRRG